MSKRLTDLTAFAASLSTSDLIHIVDVSNTSQNPAGSSFKLDLGTLATFINNQQSTYQYILDSAGTPMTQRIQLQFNAGFTLSDTPTDGGITGVSLDTTALSSIFWNTSGNSGFTGTLGTLTAHDVIFKTNNIERTRLKSNGHYVFTSDIYDSTDTLFVDITNKKLVVAAASVDVANTTLNDSNGISVHWTNRTAVSIAGNVNIKWANTFTQINGTSADVDLVGADNLDLRIGGDPNGTVGKGLYLKAFDGGAWRTGVKYLNTTGAGNPPLFLQPDGGKVFIGGAIYKDGTSELSYDSNARQFTNSNTLVTFEYENLTMKEVTGLNRIIFDGANKTLNLGTDVRYNWSSQIFYYQNANLGYDLGNGRQYASDGTSLQTDHYNASYLSLRPNGGNVLIGENSSATFQYKDGNQAANKILLSDANGVASWSQPNLSIFASTTSAQLAGIISDETGSGSLVFANTPTLVTPLLGTPTSGTLTNCTGLPLTTGVTGILPGANGGTGVNNGSSLITIGGNLTFSGAFDFTGTLTAATTVTFPTTGTLATLAGSEALTNKTYNGLTLTSTTGTFTLTNGKTLSVSNTLTFTGTDGSSVDFGAGGTVAYIPNLAFCVILSQEGASFNPADATTYYWDNNGAGTASGGRGVYLEYDCTLVAASFTYISTASASTEQGTLFVYLNGTTAYNISTTVATGGSSTGGAPLRYTGLNNNYSAGDYIAAGFTTPTYTTNPTNWRIQLCLWFKRR